MKIIKSDAIEWFIFNHIVSKQFWEWILLHAARSVQTRVSGNYVFTSASDCIEEPLDDKNDF